MVTNQPDEDEMTYEDEESGELETDMGVTFNVCVNKGGAESVVFECRSDGTYMSVVHVSIEPASGDYEDSVYTGPVWGGWGGGFVDVCVCACACVSNTSTQTLSIHIRSTLSWMRTCALHWRGTWRHEASIWNWVPI